MQLQEIPHLKTAILHAHPDHCRVLQAIILGKTQRLNRRILLEFSTFGLDEEEEEFEQKVVTTQMFSVEQLKALCVMLTIDSSGDHKDIADRLITFLNDPANFAANNIIANDEEELLLNTDSATNTVQTMTNGNLADASALPTFNRLSVLNSVASNQKLHITFEDVQSSVHHFDGSNSSALETFLAEFDEISDVLELSEVQKLVFGKRLLRGNAKLFVQSERGLTSWSKLCSALKIEFGKATTQAEVHRLLANRKLRNSETAIEYYFAVREIASRAEIDTASIIDYCIRGLPDEDSGYKLFLYESSDLKSLKSKLEIYQRHRESRVVGFRNKPIVNIQDKTISSPTKAADFRAKNNFPATSKVNSPGLVRRCYNCYSDKHLKQFCDQPPRPFGSCFICRAPDHKIGDCPQRDRQSAPTPTPSIPSFTRWKPRSAPRTPGPGMPAPMTHQNTTGAVSHLELVADKLTDVLISESSVGKVVNKCIPDYVIKAQFKQTGNKQLSTLVDTGAPISLLNKSVVDNVGVTLEPFENNLVRYEGVNQSQIVILGVTKMHLIVEDNDILVTLHVVDDGTIKYDCLLGRDVISDERIDVKFGNDVQIKFLGDVLDTQDETVQQIMHIQTIEIHSNSDLLNINKHLTFETHKEVENIIREYYIDVQPAETPLTNLELQLVLKQPHTPYSAKTRRFSFEEKKAIERIVDDLLCKGIIQCSTSQYCSNVVLVKKKDDTYRMAVDYRELNKLTERDNFPLPNIQDCLEELRDKHYFTKLDLKDAFHNIKLHLNSCKFTAFNTHLGTFEYTRIPYGIKNGTAFFMRFITSAFQELLRQHKILIYVDDIVIATETVSEHLEILSEVLTILRANCLELKFAKCEFLFTEISYLGYTIKANGITLNDEHLKAIANYPIPRNLKQLQSYLGLLSYFRRFIDNFALVSKPLYSLMKTKTAYVWTPECDDAFQVFRNLLVSSPILAIYSPELETELHCDASSYGFGSVLLQKQPQDNKFHPIAFFSKRTTPQEAKYHSFELEALAIVYALQRFHVYLQGRSFRIVTDCQSLKCTLEKKDINPRIMRWSLTLRNYDYTLEHRSNERMRHVDALSRKYDLCVITETTFEENLAILQNLDPTIVEIKKELEINQNKYYELSNGLVYRKTKDKSLFYVPKTMENNVIIASHNEVGHQATHKTVEYINRVYWFPDMRNKVQAVIDTCFKCLTFSTVKNRVEGKLHPPDKGCLPFETIHIDYFGPLQKSRSRQKYVFEVIDAFSKFVKFYATPSADSASAIKALRSYFDHYSKPKKIISDRGTAFTSDKFKVFVKEKNIQHVLIATGTPQSNGQIERVNRSLTQMLSKVCESPATWDQHLSDIEYAFNNSVNRSTNDTPSRLLFGREQISTNTDILRQLLSEFADLSRNLDSDRAKASVNIQKAASYNQNRYNLRHKSPTKYKVGDHVLITNIDVTPGINKKLLPKFRGPYVVKKVLNNDRYVICDSDNHQITNLPYEGVCSPQNMKLWHAAPILDS